MGGKFGSSPLTLFNVTTPGPLVIDLSTRLPPFPLPLRSPSAPSSHADSLARLHPLLLQMFSHSLTPCFFLSPVFLASPLMSYLLPPFLVQLSAVLLLVFHPSPPLHLKHLNLLCHLHFPSPSSLLPTSSVFTVLYSSPIHPLFPSLNAF